MIPLIVVTSLVVVISACCSLAEAVLYSVPESHIARLVDERHRAGPVLKTLRERVDEPITAILTLNTVANTAGAAVAGSLATNALGEGNLFLFSAGLTIAILLFSEILPKTIGVVFSKSISKGLAFPLYWLVWALKPIIWLIGLATRMISAGDQGGVSTDEILSLMRLGQRDGAVDEDEAAVIQNILTLSEKKVRSVMTPRTVVSGLEASVTVGELKEGDALTSHSRVPVYQGTVDDLVGIVFRRDILACEDLQTEVADLVHPATFVGDQEWLDQAMNLMLEQRQHLLLVLGEFGGFAGVITLEDVMEEILGKEIVDEFDEVQDMRELALDRKRKALARMRESDASQG